VLCGNLSQIVYFLLRSVFTQRHNSCCDVLDHVTLLRSFRQFLITLTVFEAFRLNLVNGCVQSRSVPNVYRAGYISRRMAVTSCSRLSQLRHVAKCLRQGQNTSISSVRVKVSVFMVRVTVRVSVSVTVTPVARNRLCTHWVEAIEIYHSFIYSFIHSQPSTAPLLYSSLVNVAVK